MAPLPSAYCSDIAQSSNATTSENGLSRLVEISTRLSQLNETLKTELADSRKNSAELARTLEASKTELNALKNELESLRTTSIELVSSAEKSAMESNELKAELMKAESSLMSLETSFEAYRTAAESRIVRLERSNKFWRVALVVASSLALSGWVAFAANASF